MDITFLGTIIIFLDVFSCIFRCVNQLLVPVCRALGSQCLFQVSTCGYFCFVQLCHIWEQLRVLSMYPNWTPESFAATDLPRLPTNDGHGYVSSTDALCAPQSLFFIYKQNYIDGATVQTLRSYAIDHLDLKKSGVHERCPKAKMEMPHAHIRPVACLDAFFILIFKGNIMPSKQMTIETMNWRNNDNYWAHWC